MAGKINSQSDLGLGATVIQENRTRFLNKDGTFNVHRKGIFERGNFSPYHAILNISWSRFFISVLGYYVFVNLLFAGLYVLCGAKAFPDIDSLTTGQRFGQLFFYSVQAITTLGTSPLHPATTPAAAVLSVEAVVGLLGFALASGLMFARFSNPATKILFSEKAVIAPYENITGFMVRLVNGRSNELIQVTATITLAIDDAAGKRTIVTLPLERDLILTFPLNWTLVHPINQESPLWNKTQHDLKNAHAEFLVSITAIDQDLSKTVYTRTSYRYDEVAVGVKFKKIIEVDYTGTVVVDPKRVSEIEKV